MNKLILGYPLWKLVKILMKLCMKDLERRGVGMGGEVGSWVTGVYGYADQMCGYEDSR